MPLFDGIDYASDAVFLLWFAVGMVAIGLAIGAYMVARRAGRWVGKARRRREQFNDWMRSAPDGWRIPGMRQTMSWSEYAKKWGRK